MAFEPTNFAQPLYREIVFISGAESRASLLSQNLHLILRFEKVKELCIRPPTSESTCTTPSTNLILHTLRNWSEKVRLIFICIKQRSCHIEDSEGRHVDTLGSEDGRVTREVLEGYQCYVLKAKIEFEKKE
ncbi:hypothetical protein ACJ73_09976 [Blastomyces percursus]|uniref:Uncharacterized protein n=1 Tax=Blastomyces percursus TaxID=1658174 RepID=A0A1J9Q4C6_9EURO|nr:hypothetical protein ACJ73_09976 [Blastomyces percursus]